MRFYQAWVQVVTPEYTYWNKLATPKPTEAEARIDEDHYVMCKANGTGGFRKGPPGRTRVDPVRE